MAKLDSTWWNAFSGAFDTQEDVLNFIFERLDTKDFEDGYIDCGGYGEPNETVILTTNEKRELIYDFMMSLVEE